MIKSWQSFTLGLVAATAVFGSLVLLTNGPEANADAHAPMSYLEGDGVLILTSGRVVPGKELKPYLRAMKRATDKYKVDNLTTDNYVRVLDGNWPYEGFVSVEWAPSLDVAEAFWNSPEHEAAWEMREGLIDIDWAVVVSGLNSD